MLILLLARRILRGSRHERSINIMVFICAGGIIIGTAALALVAAIMTGLEYQTHKQLQGFHSDLIVRTADASLKYSAIQAAIRTELADVATAAAPRGYGVVLVAANDQSTPTACKLVGILPDDEKKVSTLSTTVISGSWLSTNDEGILIGSSLAQSLNMHVGDEINLMYASEARSHGRKLTLDQYPVKVVGIFKTGIEEFDTETIICPLSTFAEIFPAHPITVIGVAKTPNTDDATAIARLNAVLDLEVLSWKDLYEPLVAAMLLEKYAMFLILALIALVACTNTVSLILMIMTTRRKDLAILTTLGVSDRSRVILFTLMGMIITIPSCIIGLLIATGMSYALETYHLIPLPDVYYVNYLPAHMTWGIIVLSGITVIGISFITSFFSALRARTLPIAQILKFDAY